MLIELRTSERISMKRCPQQWYWAYVDGLAPMRPANPLWFGAAYHVALAKWYQRGLKRGPHPAETFAEALEGDRSFLVTNEDEEKVYADARSLGVDMLEHYVEFYGKDEHWDVIATEKTFEVWIKNPKTGKRWVRYLGTYDGVIRDLITNEVFLLEHKTAAGIQINHLPLDDQAGSYFAVASRDLRKQGILKPGEDIAGVLYNFSRKAMRDPRPRDEQGLRHNKPQKRHYVEALAEHWVKSGMTEFDVETESARLLKMKLEDLEHLAAKQALRVLGDVSASQPPPFFERHPVYRSQGERATMVRRIQSEATYIEAWRKGELPLYKTPTRDCSWQCGFFRMCQLHEQGGSGWEEFRDAMFIQRDPYSDHRAGRKSTES